MGETNRQASRIDTLIEGRYRKLNTDSKKLYDAPKLIARNAFYKALARSSLNLGKRRELNFRTKTHLLGSN